MASLRNKAVAAHLLEAIDSRKKVDTSSGGVSFEGGFQFHGVQNLLQDLLCLAPAIPESESRRIVWQSLVEAARSGKVSVDSFIDQATSLERDYISRRPRRYVLITEISIDCFETLPSCRIDDVTISFPRQLPSGTTHHRAEIVKTARHSLHVDPPKNYRWVRASLSEKSDAGAADKALDAIQLLLGIWNLFINRGKGLRLIFNGPRKPVNTIVLGPIHTIHLPSGSLEHEKWWYQPNYCTAMAPTRLGPRLEELVQYSSTTRRRLAKISYRSRLERFIRLYNRAMEESDWSTSYLRLWQVLEVATNTTKEANHKVTVRRTSALYKDYNHHSAILDHLRELRNMMVHETEEPSTIESNLFLLKNYVENLLLFHLCEGRDFESIDEAAQVLDLLVHDDLQKRVNLFRKVQRLRAEAGTIAKP